MSLSLNELTITFSTHNLWINNYCIWGKFSQHTSKQSQIFNSLGPGDAYMHQSLHCWLPESTIPLSGPIRQINILRPRQNGCHFPDDIFKWIFLNENVWISINISLKFVPRGPINNIPTLVQVMAWCRPGDKPLSEPMMVRLPTHICVTRPQWVKGLQWIERGQGWSIHRPMWLRAISHNATGIILCMGPANEMMLHCNVASHWLGTYKKWSLMSLYLNNEMLTLDQAMAWCLHAISHWCHQTTSHYLRQCWPDLCLHMASLFTWYYVYEFRKLRLPACTFCSFHQSESSSLDWHLKAGQILNRSHFSHHF